METRRNPYRYDPAYYVQGSTVRKQKQSGAAAEESPAREPDRRGRSLYGRAQSPARRNTERREFVQGRPVRQPARRTQPQVREVQQPQKGLISLGRGVNFFGVLLLFGALFATVFVCIDYLQLQDESSRLDKSVAALESELKLLVDANNAKENLLTTDIDLERIYQTAVGELGMVFPNNNEVLYYDSANLSYVRQFSDIPAAASSILDELVP